MIFSLRYPTNSLEAMCRAVLPATVPRSEGKLRMQVTTAPASNHTTADAATSPKTSRVVYLRSRTPLSHKTHSNAYDSFRAGRVSETGYAPSQRGQASSSVPLPDVYNANHCCPQPQITCRMQHHSRARNKPAQAQAARLAQFTHMCPK